MARCRRFVTDLFRFTTAWHVSPLQPYCNWPSPVSLVKCAGLLFISVCFAKSTVGCHWSWWRSASSSVWLIVLLSSASVSSSRNMQADCFQCSWASLLSYIFTYCSVTKHGQKHVLSLPLWKPRTCSQSLCSPSPVPDGVFKHSICCPMTTL